MIKEFTYTGLVPLFNASPEKGAGVYMWMHEYCRKYLYENEEVEMVRLTLDGDEHSENMSGKVYEFKRNLVMRVVR